MVFTCLESVKEADNNYCSVTEFCHWLFAKQELERGLLSSGTVINMHLSENI